MKCPYCGSPNLEYLGIDDGHGDYSDEYVDLYRCTRCNMEFTSGETDETEIEE